MKREFEYINYPEEERRALLENSGAARYGGSGRGAPGRVRSRRRGQGAASSGPALRHAVPDGDRGSAEPGYGDPSARRHHRDAGRQDAYGPRHDRDGAEDGDYHAEYEEDSDTDDEADNDSDADYDPETDDEADAEFDADYDDDARYDQDGDYEEDAAYDEDGDYRGRKDGAYRSGADSGYRRHADARDRSGADRRHRKGTDGGYRGGTKGGYRKGGAEGGYRRADGEGRRGGGYRGAVYHVAGPPGNGARLAGAETAGYGAVNGLQEPDERTEVLINRGRGHMPPTGIRSWLRHWRVVGSVIGGVTVGAIVLAMILPGNDASWPSSVAVVQEEIAVACQNPNVVSEPSQVNFACGKDTSQILWVFSLLTSGDAPNYSDAANGRKGLEPITPAQGGDVAWSLNLHHPYDPANPTDSLEVAARAINDIIGGATLTGSDGAPVVQPGLESTAANCARYTGSPALVTRQGFPAVCAQAVTSPDGQAALVSDVFQQWMVGAPPAIAAEAGVLFENGNNPGDPRVQAILNGLPQTGL